MAQAEFTQQFNIPYTSGARFYVQLQSTLGVYIVKGFTCYSTANLFSAGAGSLEVISATNGSGGGLEYIYSTDASISANTMIPLFSPTSQIILNQSYLGFLPIGASGNIVIQISYIFIPTTNVNAANFGNFYTNVTNGTGATFTGLSATIPTLVKSINIINPTSISSVTVTPLLTTPTTTDLAFDQSTVLAPGQSCVYTLPLYLLSDQSISIESVGLGTVQVFYSYTQDPTSY